jgi:hypothetical protein
MGFPDLPLECQLLILENIADETTMCVPYHLHLGAARQVVCLSEFLNCWCTFSFQIALPQCLSPSHVM